MDHNDFTIKATDEQIVYKGRADFYTVLQIITELVISSAAMKEVDPSIILISVAAAIADAEKQLSEENYEDEDDDEGEEESALEKLDSPLVIKGTASKLLN